MLWVLLAHPAPRGGTPPACTLLPAQHRCLKHGGSSARLPQPGGVCPRGLIASGRRSGVSPAWSMDPAGTLSRQFSPLAPSGGWSAWGRSSPSYSISPVVPFTHHRNTVLEPFKRGLKGRSAIGIPPMMAPTAMIGFRLGVQDGGRCDATPADGHKGHTTPQLNPFHMGMQGRTLLSFPPGGALSMMTPLAGSTPE